MAELCARQGRLGEAIAIFHRLLAAHPRHEGRSRWTERLSELEGTWQEIGGGPTLPEEVPIPRPPGVTAVSGQDAAGRTVAVFAWALPASPSPPVLEALLITRGADGIETERRRFELAASAGRLVLPVVGLHTTAAAIGHLAGDRFVAVARSMRPPG